MSDPVLHDLVIRPVSVGKILLQRSHNVAEDKMAKLGIDIPLQVGRRTVDRDRQLTMLCLAPDRWLVICPEDVTGQLAADIERAAGPDSIFATVMTDQYLCLDIAGGNSRALLAKGCGLNLDREVFTGDQVASTLLAQADIVLWRPEITSFRILVDVSLENYLRDWIRGASAEFAMRESQ